MRRLFTLASVLVSLVAAPSVGFAAPAPFSVIPNASLIKFESEAPVENITGLSTEAKGTLQVDRDRPAATTGTLAIPVASLRTGNTTRDGHLQSKDWLDAATNPDITFAIASVNLADGGALVAGAAARKGTATGTLTIKGKARTITAPITVQYLAANERFAKAYIVGDVVRVKATFEVALADYGIQAPAHIADLKVASTVTISASVTASSGAK